jgi:hypothetical protein
LKQILPAFAIILLRQAKRCAPAWVTKAVTAAGRQDDGERPMARWGWIHEGVLV